MELRSVARAARNLGVVPTANYALQRIRDRLARTGEARLHPRLAHHPLVARLGSSDLDVFRQIFVHREYRCLDHVRHAAFIIDCGANVGYSAAYFLTRFPRAELVAIEPDDGNFSVLARNLLPYGPRARALRTGVWSHATRLVVSEASHGDNREWARTVREARPEEPGGMPAVDVGSLLDASGHERISILKIDIEGAEAVVFGAACPWLDRVDNMVVELHGPGCRAALLRAVEGRGFRISECEELTVCTRD